MKLKKRIRTNALENELRAILGDTYDKKKLHETIEWIMSMSTKELIEYYDEGIGGDIIAVYYKKHNRV